MVLIHPKNRSKSLKGNQMTVYILRDIQTSLWLLTSVLRAHDFGWVEIKVKLIIKKN